MAHQPAPTSFPSSRVDYKRQIGRWCGLVAAAVLLASYSMVGYAWIHAAMTDRWPSAQDMARYERTGNGPWEHQRDLNLIVSRGMFLPLFATALAIVASILRPSVTTVTLLAMCLISFCTLISTQIWLID